MADDKGFGTQKPGQPGQQGQRGGQSGQEGGMDGSQRDQGGQGGQGGQSGEDRFGEGSRDVNEPREGQRRTGEPETEDDSDLEG